MKKPAKKKSPAIKEPPLPRSTAGAFRMLAQILEHDKALRKAIEEHLFNVDMQIHFLKEHVATLELTMGAVNNSVTRLLKRAAGEGGERDEPLG